ncbi:hydantoinase/oxoprolinase N-terminal domain-containing protein [Porticoccus sp. GXU_MW_L64]
MRVGVDVGGTNTDAVLMDGDRVLASCKQPTTDNVSDGIVAAIQKVLDDSQILPSQIQCVMIGTTHFTNAFVERKQLLEVGLIRVCLPAARGVHPLVDWPEEMVSAIGQHTYMVGGGYQFDGRQYAPLDEQAVISAAEDLKQKDIKAVAISAVFSSIKSDLEEQCSELVKNILGEDVAITLSHKIGRVGLLERENAAVMNAALSEISVKVVDSFREALARLDIRAPFYISQNDGTLMSASQVEKYPVMTFASGPTNSMRGAAYLSGKKDALVADIGGTTTDIGMLSNGFPRESSVTVDIGGVRTNFRMPDVLALGLGGGSKVVQSEDSLKIGPESVGYQLTSKSQVFGGDTLTATDIAVSAGYANVGDKELVSNLPELLVSSAVDRIHQMIADGVDRMKTSSDSIPLILVGGGSILVDQHITGTSEVIIPPHAGVANAIGASIAQVAGEVDKVYAYEQVGRDEAIAMAQKEAIQSAIQNGAHEESIEVLDIEETPLAYAPNGSTRLRIRVAGDLKLPGRGEKV